MAFIRVTVIITIIAIIYNKKDLKLSKILGQNIDLLVGYMT